MASCAACKGPLEVVVELNDGDDDDDNDGDVQMTADASSSNAAGTSTVPDDVELRCGCHFHWQCLLDAVEDTNWKCPNCSSTLTERSQSGKQQLLCNIINEGGVLAGHDILPLLVEDTYLRSHPEERRCHAFLEFCREGDVEAMADVLRDDEGEDDNILTTDNDILRYQDPLGSMSSGLHIAVEAKQSQVAWMLLLLASNLDLEQFPPEVHRAADILGVARQDQSGKVDIRTLRDAEGRTAEQLAIPIGGIWDEWLNRGRLAG